MDVVDGEILEISPEIDQGDVESIELKERIAIYIYIHTLYIPLQLS